MYRGLFQIGKTGEVSSIQTSTAKGFVHSSSIPFVIPKEGAILAPSAILSVHPTMDFFRRTRVVNLVEREN